MENTKIKNICNYLSDKKTVGSANPFLLSIRTINNNYSLSRIRFRKEDNNGLTLGEGLVFIHETYICI